MPKSRYIQFEVAIFHEMMNERARILNSTIVGLNYIMNYSWTEIYVNYTLYVAALSNNSIPMPPYNVYVFSEYHIQYSSRFQNAH